MEFNADQIYEIVQKLTGKIRPVGESNEDEKRLKNVKVFIEVFGKMHAEIDGIGYDYIDRHEASMVKIAEVCNEHIDTMGICNGECGG
jgi:hypothetical protein